MAPTNPPSFAYFDGDDVGARIELLLLSNDVDGAAELSSHISDAIANLAKSLKYELQADVKFAAGDEVLASVPVIVTSQLEQLRDRFLERSGITISCGIGVTAQQASQSLHLAKLRGKNRLERAGIR